MLEDLLKVLQGIADDVRYLRSVSVTPIHQTGSTDLNRPLARDEAAAYLGVHKDTLYRWAVEEGRIAYSRLGEGGRAALRFSKQDLDDFVSRQRISSLEETRTHARL